MRKISKGIIIKYFVFLLFFQAVLYSQSSWFNQPTGTNKKINTIFFLNDNTGFAAGNGGVILKTTNSGVNWVNIYSAAIYDARTVSFLNSTTGWAYIKSNISDSLFFLKTVNSGSSWTKIFIDTSSSQFNSAEIKFFNENTGYLANSIDLRKTTNGGLSWSLTNLSIYIPSCLYFLSENTGWVGGFQTSLFKTTDGGQNWLQQFENQPNTTSREIIFPNSTTGFYATDYYVYRSTDGGENWSESFYVNNIYPVSMTFINVNTGWCLSTIADTTFRNVVLKTTDAGLSWGTYELLLPGRRFNNIFFSSQNTGWLAGDSGFIYKTTTGGVPIGIEPVSTEIPVKYSLSQNYPNPFNPTTKIKFALSGNSAVQVLLSVYDILGNELAILVKEALKPGTYEVDFNASNFPSGIYYYKLQAGDYTETRKMVLVK